MSQPSSVQDEPVLQAQAGSEKQRNPWLVLLVLCAAIFMLLLDTTIVNVAQREIQLGLGASLSEIQWVLDSYILTYAVLLLSFGRMGDVFGRKRMFILGMGIFTAASALCAAAETLGDIIGVSGVNALIFARVLQGLGGAFMMPQTLALISVVFPPEKRGAAMGIWGGIVALGAVIGPVLGGYIVTDYAWEWIFLINLPIGIAAIFATIAIVPESVDPQASRRIDWGGVLLSGFGIFALVFALIEGSVEGWSSPLIIGMFAASAVLLPTFVWWETRVADPMMKLELFKIRNFTMGNVIALVVAFGMFGIFFPLTLFLQGVLGYTPIRAGLTTTPMALMIMVAAPISGRLTDKIGARWILVTGLSLMTAGILFITTQIDLNTDWQALAPPLIVTGLGMGMTFAPMTAAAMRDVPQRISGSASGILNTTRNIGQVLGIAVLGSVLQTRLVSHGEDRLADIPLEPAARDQAIDLAKNNRFEEIPAVVPPDLLPAVFGNLQQAFVDSIHNTFAVSAFSCLVGVGAAFMISNSVQRRANDARGVPEPAREAEVVRAAD